MLPSCGGRNHRNENIGSGIDSRRWHVDDSVGRHRFAANVNKLERCIPRTCAIVSHPPDFVEHLSASQIGPVQNGHIGNV